MLTFQVLEFRVGRMLLHWRYVPFAGYLLFEILDIRVRADGVKILVGLEGDELECFP